MEDSSTTAQPGTVEVREPLDTTVSNPRRVRL
jgi:hypothetical protein